MLQGLFTTALFFFHSSRRTSPLLSSCGDSSVKWIGRRLAGVSGQLSWWRDNGVPPQYLAPIGLDLTIGQIRKVPPPPEAPRLLMTRPVITWHV